MHSSAYVNVPIVEFGAVMLRGMGWTGDGSGNGGGNNQKKEEDIKP